MASMAQLGLLAFNVTCVQCNLLAALLIACAAEEGSSSCPEGEDCSWAWASCPRPTSSRPWGCGTTPSPTEQLRRPRSTPCAFSGITPGTQQTNACTHSVSCRLACWSLRSSSGTHLAVACSCPVVAALCECMCSNVFEIIFGRSVTYFFTNACGDKCSHSHEQEVRA